ncbi:MAG: ribosomal protein S19 family protein [Candidatus Aenigmarchaeota archaeon]|nr:ribosomal protein S19 family protein [Candidatus Aenigmarchaeota archaeon]
MAREFSFRGKTFEDLKKMSIDEIARLLPSRERRTLKRGMTEEQKKFLEKTRKNPDKFHKTHLRAMIILPEMVGKKLGVYRGGAAQGDKSNKWFTLEVKPEMVGFRLGDFAIPVKRVQHSSPGIGASKSTKHSSMRTT